MLWLLLGHALAAPGWNPTDPKAIELFNDSLDLLTQAAPERAEKLLKKARKTEPSGMVEHLYATSILRQNRADEAIALYADLADTYPDQPEVWAGYSEALFVGEEFQAAQEAALRGVDVDPSNFNVQQVALQADLRLGTYDAARARLTDYAAGAGPGDADCLFIRLALETDDEAMAKAHEAPCLEHSEPETAEAVQVALAAQGWEWTEASNTARSMGADRFADLARVMDLMAQERYEEALAAANAAIEAHGGDPGLRLVRGTLLIELGDKEAGLAELESVFASPDWVDAERGGSMTGIVTAKAKKTWDTNVTTAVAYAVAVYEELGQGDRAEKLIAQTRERVGSAEALDVARTDLALSRGEPKPWQHAEKALSGLADAPNAEGRLGELLFHHGGAPESIVAFVAGKGSKNAVQNAMAGAANRQEYELCLRMATAKTERFSPEPSDAGLAYSCAVGAKRADAAMDWMRRALDAGSARPGTVQNHLAWLANDGKLADARSVLDAGRAGLDAGFANDLDARLLTEAGELDAALAAADKPGVDPKTRYNIGVALYNANRDAEAKALFTRTCPELDGEVRTWCEDALKALK